MCNSSSAWRMNCKAQTPGLQHKLFFARRAGPAADFPFTSMPANAGMSNSRTVCIPPQEIDETAIQINVFALDATIMKPAPERAMQCCCRQRGLSYSGLLNWSAETGVSLISQLTSNVQQETVGRIPTIGVEPHGRQHLRFHASEAGNQAIPISPPAKREGMSARTVNRNPAAGCARRSKRAWHCAARGSLFVSARLVGMPRLNCAAGAARLIEIQDLALKVQGTRIAIAWPLRYAQANAAGGQS